LPAIKPFIYLASQSPRRRELLDRLHVRHELLVADDDEDVEALEDLRPNEAPRAYVMRVTLLKAEAALARLWRRALPIAPVLVGDTTVALGRTILAKPGDDADARRMLAMLSGRTHRVLTAIAVAEGTRIETALSVSQVRMRAIGCDEIDTYVASGEARGKAGAYAIQGRAAAFIERIVGSHSGIVGLPLFETAQLLKRFHVGMG
jgi:septum formation protein